MYLKTLRIFLLLSIVIVIQSCGDDPTDVGGVLIPDKDKIEFKKIDSYHNSFEQKFTSFQKDSLYYGSSKRILLGAYKNLSIDMLVGFGIILPDSVKKDYKDSKITLKTSWFEMKPNYWLGDNTQFEFSVKKINTSWNTTKFTIDTLNMIKNSLSGEVLLKDTYVFTDSLITFSLEENVVKEWVLNVSNDLFFKNNLYFTPVTSNGIAGFQALAKYPTSEYITLYMVFEKEGVYVDTIKAFPSVDIHVVTNTPVAVSEREIVLQSASKYRGKLWFDVSAIPLNAILNKATLDLFVDKDNSDIGTVKTDSVIVSFYEEGKSDNELKKSVLFNKDSCYSGDVRGFIQKWINGENNSGMEVRLSDEERTANTISFYGSDYQVDSLKPRLTIFYTTAKKND